MSVCISYVVLLLVSCSSHCKQPFNISFNVGNESGKNGVLHQHFKSIINGTTDDISFDVPLFATYLSICILLVAIPAIIIPAVLIIHIILTTEKLHTVYYLFVINYWPPTFKHSQDGIRNYSYMFIFIWY